MLSIIISSYQEHYYQNLEKIFRKPVALNMKLLKFIILVLWGYVKPII